MPQILIQTLKFQKKSLVFWTIGILILIALYMALYPSIKDSAAELNAYIEKLPEALKSVFIDEETDYASPLGYISSEIYSQMLPILFLFYAIGFGSSLVAGEEEKGTLDIVLSTPINRSRFIVEKFAALIAGLAYLSLLIILCLFIGTKFVDIEVTISQLSSATFSLFLLSLNFGALAFFIGSITGSKGLAIGLTTAFAVLSFFVSMFYKLVDQLDLIKEFSPFFHYSDQNALIHGVSWASAALLIWAIAALFVLSIIAFQRRDLNV